MRKRFKAADDGFDVQQRCRNLACLATSRNNADEHHCENSRVSRESCSRDEATGFALLFLGRNSQIVCTLRKALAHPVTEVHPGHVAVGGDRLVDDRANLTAGVEPGCIARKHSATDSAVEKEEEDRRGQSDESGVRLEVHEECKAHHDSTHARKSLGDGDVDGFLESINITRVATDHTGSTHSLLTQHRRVESVVVDIL